MATEVASDDFTGLSAGESLETYDGTNWTDRTTDYMEGATGGGAATSATGDACNSTWTGDTFDDDQYAKGTVSSMSYLDFIGVVVRSTNSGADNYWFGADSGWGSFLTRADSGSPTTIKSDTGIYFVNGDVVELQSDGSTHSCLVDDATHLTDTTDSTHTSGVGGVGGQGAGSKLDDWSAGNLADSGVIGSLTNGSLVNGGILQGRLIGN